MNILHRGFRLGILHALLFCLALQSLVVPQPALAINITIDYDYDDNDFFTNNQPAKNALQAAANRYSAIITETLLAASLPNNIEDPRIGFHHPATGLIYEVSPATSTANDAIVAASGPAANEYRGPWSIAANEWILYAGGRSLATDIAGEGGTGTGRNFTTVFASGTSHLNRGFRSTGSVDHLPVWGGSITFDNDGSTVWHFNPDTTPPAGSLDFYSIALHEIGHALGLSADSTDWDQFRVPPSSGQFQGPQTVAAYNADNGTSVTFLNQESSANRHWDDGAYDSRIFMNASPKLVATVGAGGMQDLLMEPTANSTATVKRFELTNVDVAALCDLGWSTVPQITTQLGDYNKNGTVDAADYVVFSKGLADGNYATWRSNFGESTPGGSPANSPYQGAVPEPTSWLFLLFAISPFISARRPPRSC